MGLHLKIIIIVRPINWIIEWKYVDLYKNVSYVDLFGRSMLGLNKENMVQVNFVFCNRPIDIVMILSIIVKNRLEL